jgi:hypothetical protein
VTLDEHPEGVAVSRLCQRDGVAVLFFHPSFRLRELSTVSRTRLPAYGGEKRSQHLDNVSKSVELCRAPRKGEKRSQDRERCRKVSNCVVSHLGAHPKLKNEAKPSSGGQGR